MKTENEVLDAYNTLMQASLVAAAADLKASLELFTLAQILKWVLGANPRIEELLQKCKYSVKEADKLLSEIGDALKPVPDPRIARG